jgi:hypothetical protein
MRVEMISTRVTLFLRTREVTRTYRKKRATKDAGLLHTSALSAQEHTYYINTTQLDRTVTNTQLANSKAMERYPRSVVALTHL